MSEDKHSGARHALDKASDAIGGAVGKASAATAGSKSTTSFVTNAVQSDNYELRSSELAVRRARSEEVRAVAEQMIEDHKSTSQKLQSVLSSSPDLNKPDQAIDARRRSLLDHLEKAPDDDFDATYLDQQLAAHEEATTLYRGYAEHGDHSGLKGFAAETLPKLERHLEHVREARG